ncbi:MAG: glycosyltransferase family 4 protein [Actinomyces ruminicola]|uniref:Glycosyl transferases group 1 n=1 Tax=Actinomyces ruminicola TaxID=332524 RepID=A0A1G9SN37_9ACTO|nr:glycosyltransferase [Actinomyces ruminicola]MBE6482925.1 glycosyltransferase family 4 protein [Actinomyces ruminicola]SDM36720.1 Glycosyl transferases group 1 [Actinomyces ruminicola]
MPRTATGITGIAARAAASPPGQAALASVTLARLRLAIRRGDAVGGAIETARRARFLADRGETAHAHRLLRRAHGILSGRRAAAVVAVEDAILAMNTGTRSAPGGLPDRALTDLLAEADAAWAAGADAAAEELLDMAVRAMFHPSLHFSAAPSALAADPTVFLAPLRASTAWTAATAPVAKRRPVPRRTGGPRRLLFISLKNWTFVRDIVEDYRADPRCEVHTLDLLDLPTRPSRRRLLHSRLRLARGADPAAAGLLTGVSDEIAAVLAWADTIFVEWGGAAAVWASLLAPLLAPQARLLIRVHSYEASTVTPQLVDWAAVDRLVTVAPAIREVLRASLHLPEALEVVTIPNRAQLRRFALPKEPSAARTLALVGWAALRKDPAWALDTLDLLCQNDPAWHLLLIGPGFSSHLSPEERIYADAVTARLAALGNAVTITGRTEAVPQYLRRTAVILSASRREGTHEGFIEGVASGALPVCRNWPDVARWGGPAALFPADWVVDTPQEAAARILALADDVGYRRRQQEHILRTNDWSHVRAHYDALFLGGDAAR